MHKWQAMIYYMLPLAFVDVTGFQQNDYNLTSERIEVVKSNAKYMIITSANFKYNRTFQAINVTFDVRTDMGYDIEFYQEGYKFVSNEYRTFPFLLKYNFCEELAKNDFGLKDSLKCGNFVGCPFTKGMHLICNWAPDGSQFPPHIPAGSFMVDVKIMHFSNFVGNIQWYFKVERRMHWS